VYVNNYLVPQFLLVDIAISLFIIMLSKSFLNNFSSVEVVILFI